MNDIYAAPQAELEQLNNKDIKAFYVVSPAKFFLMYFATFGVYSYYWFYKNWAHQKRIDNENLSPFWRTVFQFFFVHSLFTRIEMLGNDEAINKSWSATLWASIYVAIILATRILDQMAFKEIGSPYTDLAGYPLILVEFVILFRVQKIINLACNDPQGSSNSRITALNIVWIIAGALIWGLTILGGYLLLLGDPGF